MRALLKGKGSLINRFLIILLIISVYYKDSFSQAYFQQEVNHKISVTLNDKQHELSGFESIEYINNAPDTLSYLFFHLWPNAYANNNTALAKQLFRWNGKEKLFSDPDIRGYIDSLDYKADGQRIKWYLLPDTPDICKVILPRPLIPGDTINITTPFFVKIPRGAISRLGHIGESYQITQWYPKPAVYDKNGWHPMPYLDQGEFYSEFGHFEVSITLPSNYVVGATGNLQNPEEIDMLNRLALETARKTHYDEATNFPPSSDQLKTLHYNQSNIHDFAWFADKRYHVMKGKIRLPDSGKEVTTWTMYTNQHAALWKAAIDNVNDAIVYFSKIIGDYPYDNFTAVQSLITNGDGMEYPGAAIIGFAEDAYALDEVITHEICHNWHYSALGYNERRYPFMDEGITSAYETRYMHEKYPGTKFWKINFKNTKLAAFLKIDKIPLQQMNELDWLIQARSNIEQPLNLPAKDFSFQNYNLLIYYKAPLGFNFLRLYLGNRVFDSIMQKFYRKWKFKHPQPEDLQHLMESETGKDLSWFFKDFVGTAKRLDYKISRFKNQQVLIKNKGQLTSPFIIAGMKDDSICFSQWSEGFQGKKWIGIPRNNFSALKIDPEHITPEISRMNNNIRTSGIFRKADPFTFKFAFGFEDPEKRSVMYIPALNWNKFNGLMVGIALHNGFYIPKIINYFVLPFFSITRPEILGYGNISYNIIPYNNFMRRTSLSLEGLKFGAPGKQNFTKIKAGLDIYIRNAPMINSVKHKAYIYYYAASDLLRIQLLQKAPVLSFIQFGHLLVKEGLINPYSLLTSFEFNQFFQKTYLEFNYRYSYNKIKRGLDIRVFTGMMLKHDPRRTFYAFATSARSGRELYLFQGIYIDRFTEFQNSLWSRQMTISEGGLVSFMNKNLGYSKWLLSLTLSGNLPGKAGILPIKPFLNLLWNEHGTRNGYNSPIFFETGVKTGMWNFFEIYIPLLISQNINYNDRSFKNRIRFEIKLGTIREFRLKSRVIN